MQGGWVLATKENKSYLTFFIVLSFYILTYFGFLWVKSESNEFMSQFFQLRSEYKVVEQLTKYYLLIGMLASFLLYGLEQNKNKVLLSLSYLFLFSAMYLSESNMIDEGAQPIFGVLGFAAIFVLLFKLREYISFLFVFVSLMFICTGVLTDYYSEGVLNQYSLTEEVKIFFSLVSEERSDLRGVGFLSLSVASLSRFHMLPFFKRDPRAVVFLMLGLLCLSLGNGFIHFQYKPSPNLYLFSLLLMYSGFLIALYCLKYLSRGVKFYFNINNSILIIVSYVFFLLLPSIYGRHNAYTAILLCLPSLLISAISLWRSHASCSEVTKRF